MSTSNSIRRAVRYALLTSAAAASLPAYAQDQTIQEVVVTGSRIAQPNLETTSPVTQVTAEDVITQGVTKIEDLVNQLPQAFAAQNATVANGATGTATVNLRGLGSPRTLVLVDGRRMPYGGVDSGSAAPDLNQIPTAMVERVEVLTGGASAVYGSDAIAGVVNFIMKKDFEGVQIDAQYSLYQHNNDFSGPGAVELRDVISGRAATNPTQFALPDDNVTDGNSVQGTITIGVSTDDGRGNITAYASYQDNKEVLQRDRDYSACSLGHEQPDGLVRVRRIEHVLPRAVHRTSCRPIRRLHCGHGRATGNLPRLRQHQPGSVQLRPAQSLPASRHPLQPGRDGPLRAG